MRQFKLLVSLMVFVADGVFGTLGRVFGLRRPARCVVLFYHSVMDDQREGFARQMDTVLRHARVVNPATPAPLERGANYVAITFDDANANIIANALPTLRQRGIPAMIFVISDRLGVIPDWENFGPDYTPEERTITAEQLRALPADGLHFGSHTRTHPVLTKLDESRAREELVNSRRELEALLGRDIQAFSFPYGAYNERLIQLCREAGYERVFTTDPVFAFQRKDDFVVGRVAAEPTDGGLEFRLKVAGAYRWVKAASDLKQKLRGLLAGASA
ncbi:MAG TPA: polysaccharide deacetylase family protein [Verrucomicrobiae bacterium]|nr:polysaccharide deacetylase family protein [Verrucomicrobiae bacterium]